MVPLKILKCLCGLENGSDRWMVQKLTEVPCKSWRKWGVDGVPDVPMDIITVGMAATTVFGNEVEAGGAAARMGNKIFRELGNGNTVGAPGSIMSSH